MTNSIKSIDDELLEEFKICYLNHSNHSQDDVIDWFSLSIGFFLAKGLNIKKAYELSLDARYKHEYWN